ncbi:MAG: hypothetical protein IJ557_02930 [Bacteroidaceae bacterium]|nr:hypothetical protein [Bacteroidaceae bacterium]
MKTIITTILLLASCLSLAAQDLEPKDAQQQPVDLDSMRYTLKQRELIQRRTTLEQQIRQEDERRGATVPGATPTEQEAANMAQDSICLALRSELVDVNLAIEELTAQGITTTTSTPAMPDASTITLPAQPTTNTRPTLRDIIDSVRK